MLNEDGAHYLKERGTEGKGGEGDCTAIKKFKMAY
jgi:hypothetical protein